MRHYTQRIIEHTTNIVATTFSESHCVHKQWRKHGISENGKQRFMCMACGLQRREGAWDNKITRIHVLAPLFKAGVNITHASKKTGYSHETIRSYYRKFMKLSQPPLCECGRPGFHLGWCSARIKAAQVRNQSTEFIRGNLSKRWVRTEADQLEGK